MAGTDYESTQRDAFEARLAHRGERVTYRTGPTAVEPKEASVDALVGDASEGWVDADVGMSGGSAQIVQVRRVTVRSDDVPDPRRGDVFDLTDPSDGDVEVWTVDLVESRGFGRSRLRCVRPVRRERSR